MNAAAIAAAIAVVEELMKLIPQWIENAKAKGELTAEQEASFQARQAAVFGKDYAQPDQPHAQPAAAPDLEPPAQ